MEYKALDNQAFVNGNLSIVPIRMEDRFVIKKWRNEQIFHLRQSKPLTDEAQEVYFNTVINELFDQEHPSQILFSYLENDVCIGYGGLVHINWVDKNAEISFIMNTELEKEHFATHWTSFIMLVEQVGFKDLNLHKLCTYAFDLRPQLYAIIENAGFSKEATLKEHCLFDDQYKDVVIHSKFNRDEKA